MDDLNSIALIPVSTTRCATLEAPYTVLVILYKYHGLLARSASRSLAYTKMLEKAHVRARSVILFTDLAFHIPQCTAHSALESSITIVIVLMIVPYFKIY